MLSCPVCVKDCACVLSLYYHLPVHIPKEQRFNCLVCERVFYEKSRLRTHERIYNGECKNEEPGNKSEYLYINNKAEFFEDQLLFDQGDAESMGFEEAAKMPHIQKTRAANSDDDADDNVSCYNNDQTMDYIESTDDFLEVSPIPNVLQSPANRGVLSSFLGDNLKQEIINDAVPQASTSSSQRVLCTVQAEEPSEIKSEPEHADEGCLGNAGEWGLIDSDVCNKHFSSKCSLIAHKQIHAVKSKNCSPYICMECGRRFNLSALLEKHQRIHFENPTVSRGELQKEYSDKKETYEADGREKQENSEALYCCPHCSKVLSDASALRNHMIKHVYKRQFSCNQCPKTFKYKRALEKHVLMHTSDSRFSCTMCTRACNNESCLKTHMQKHIDAQPHACSHCHERFSQRYQLRMHEKYKHKNEQVQTKSSSRPRKAFACSICDRHFCNQGNLNVHMRKHKGERRYACSHCSERFDYQYQLHLHMETKHKIQINLLCKPKKAYPCSICDKSFGNQSNLNVHLRKHTGERPYLCSHCLDRFDYKHQLCSHEETVHNVQRTSSPKPKKAFACSICDKGFVNQSNLNVHMLKHTGERRYTCSHCDERFNSRHQLRMHEETRHKAKPKSTQEVFVCSICDESFNCEDRLMSHKETRHYHLEHESTNAAGEVASTSSEAVLFINEGTLPKTTKEEVESKSTHGGENIVKNAERLNKYGSEAREELFSSMCTLSDHRLYDTLETQSCGPLACAKCEQRFESEVLLKEHKNIHSENPTVIGDELQNEHSDNKEHSEAEEEETGGGVYQESRKAPYCCPHCHKTCLHASALRNHMIKHTYKRQFSCNQCTKAFKYKHTLKNHVLMHTFECQTLPRSDKDTDAIDNIQTTSSKIPKKYICSICNKNFAYESRLLSHIRQHSDTHPFSCSLCKNTFKTQKALDNHTVTHTSCHRFPCTVCHKGFIGLSYLKVHMRLHTGERPYACSSCNKSFTQIHHLASHERLHQRQKSKDDWEFVCAECGEKFAFLEKLEEHKIMKHSGEYPFVCNKCGKGFVNAAMLRIHERRNQNCKNNDDDRSHLCCMCDKRFKTAGELKSHEMIHSGERPYACAHCDKRFSHPSNRSQHEETHRVNRLYNCESCDKQFTSKAGLYIHKRFHHSGREKPFKCSECPNAFHTAVRLRDHVLRHRDLREFECSHCDQRFNVKGDVLGHVKQVHAEIKRQNRKQ